MLYLANGPRSVNAINLRGLCRRHLPEAKLVALAVETRLGLAQPTHFRTRACAVAISSDASQLLDAVRDGPVVDSGVDRASGHVEKRAHAPVYPRQHGEDDRRDGRVSDIYHRRNGQ